MNLKKDWKMNSCIEKIIKQVNHLIFATELNDVNSPIFQYYGNLVHYDDPSIQISCKITFTQKRRKNQIFTWLMLSINVIFYTSEEIGGLHIMSQKWESVTYINA